MSLFSKEIGWNQTHQEVGGLEERKIVRTSRIVIIIFDWIMKKMNSISLLGGAKPIIVGVAIFLFRLKMNIQKSIKKLCWMCVFKSFQNDQDFWSQL